MQQVRAPSVPFFELIITRGTATTTLKVPYTFSQPVRRQRLSELLEQEHWKVVDFERAANRVASGWGGTTTRQAQMEELLFVRDVLGPLRLRPGVVPEKVVGKLLEVGVKALHLRSKELFNRGWKEFLESRFEPDPEGLPNAPEGFIPALPALTEPAHTEPTPAEPAMLVVSTPVLAPAPAPVAPPVLAALVPLDVPPASQEEQEDLAAFLLGPPALPCPDLDFSQLASTDSDIDSLLTGEEVFQLDMPAALLLEREETHTAHTPLVTPPLVPMRPATSTITTAATPAVWEDGVSMVPTWSERPPELELLDSLEAELEPLTLPALTLASGGGLDSEALLGLDVPEAPLPAFWPEVAAGGL